MSVVVIALLPALLFGMYNVGLQHFRAMGMTDLTVMECFGFWLLESIAPYNSILRGRPRHRVRLRAGTRPREVNEGFLVSGMLMPMIMPVDAPLWMVAVSTAFAVIIGKEVFGGTGMNVFNPALLARAFMFFAYTLHLGRKDMDRRHERRADGRRLFGRHSPYGDRQLDRGKAPALNISSSVCDWIVGTIPGSIGETSFIAIMIGAAILLSPASHRGA